jgi:putative membrane protein
VGAPLLAETESSPGWASLLLGLALGWLLLAAAFAITSWLIDGMDISGGFWSYVWVSAIFGLVNAVVGTILRILTLPLTLLTLGLFSVIVNAILLSITDALSDSLTIDEFWWTAIWAAIVLAVVSVVLQAIVRSVLRRGPAASH